MGGCWPEVEEKQEGLEDVFTDEDNSPLHNPECIDLFQNDELFDINMIKSMDSILNGDPALNEEDAVSTEELFERNDRQVWDMFDPTIPEDMACNDVGSTLTETKIEATNANGLSSGLKDVSLSTPLDSNSCTDMEKQTSLEFCDDLLSTCRLEEMFDGDLNTVFGNMCCGINSIGSTFTPPASVTR